MTHSHPMIQPVSWTAEDHPDSVAKELPLDRAAIYRLVWNTSLACAMRPPLLEHTRCIWTSSTGIKVAVASCIPVEGQEGYWVERKDFPKSDWPTVSETPRLEPGSVRIAYWRVAAGPSPGQVIQGLSDARISTPATIASLYSQVLEVQIGNFQGTGPTALVSVGSHRDRKVVALTDCGRDLLEKWRSAGQVNLIAERNELVDAVERGETHARDALESLAKGASSLKPMADAVARQIDELCEKWGGTSREEAFLDLAKMAYRPPKLSALPAWIDPALNLPSDHPLHAWRERMEAELAQVDPSWRLLDMPTQAVRRERWLSDHAQAIEASGGGPEFTAAMDPVTGRYSALKYWLTGATRPGGGVG